MWSQECAIDRRMDRDTVRPADIPVTSGALSKYMTAPASGNLSENAGHLNLRQDSWTVLCGTSGSLDLR